MESILKIVGVIVLIIIYLIVFYHVYDGYEMVEDSQTMTPKEEVDSFKLNIEKQIINEDKVEVVKTDNEKLETSDSKLVSLGEFKLTAYCACSKCCGKWANNRPKDEYWNEIVYGAIGEQLKEGYSIAVDPKVIPYRTEVVINGHTYKSQDCGGAIKGNRIDIYFDDHNKALEFGVQYDEVFVVQD